MLVAPDIAPVFVIPPLLLFIPPVIDAPPALTVRPFADVIAPVPVVTIFPLVERFPASDIVRVADPLLCTCNAFWIEALVSLMTRAALPVPALVRVSWRELPFARVKPIVP